MRARDEAAADASELLAADPTAASDDRRRGRQARRRTTGGSPESTRSRASGHDLGRGRALRVAGNEGKLSRAQRGGSGDGGSTTSAVADGTRPTCGRECCSGLGTRKRGGSCCSPHDRGSAKEQATRMERRRRSTQAGAVGVLLQRFSSAREGGDPGREILE
jgi:hypothetical protein